MITLSPWQTDSLNAAADALDEIYKEHQIRLHMATGYRGEGYSVFCSSHDFGAAPTAPAIFAKGATFSEAVADLLRQIEEVRNAPPKLTTAREAIDAARVAIEANYPGEPMPEPVARALEGLPVA